MSRSLRELSPEEVQALLLDLLRRIRDFPDTVGRLSSAFATEKNLLLSTVRRLANILWFGGFIRTVYLGFPPRPFYSITDKGSAVLARGKFSPEDWLDVPRWVRRWTRRYLPPFKPVLYLPLGNFGIWVEEDWNYSVYVETPTESYWPWFRIIDPTVAKDIVDPSSYGFIYVPKLRALEFIEASGVRPRLWSIVGHKWVRLHPEVRTARWVRIRYHRIWDPKGKIVPQRLPSPFPDKVRWKVDLSPIKEHLPSVFPIMEAKTRLEKKRPVRVVSSVFEK